ncbi:MAG: precorrin-3B C(17)-methyltransferase [Blautia sp.]|nr:precorrin-3B C(17)-methyltransferase [Blautia sp.]
MNKIYIVGIGPGEYGQMTAKAVKALAESDVIAGYTVYVDLVQEFFPEKKFITTPMRRERERCVMAFQEASKGLTVAMVCSGDAGVYGMAGLIFELSPEFPDTQIEVVPGVTSALSGAALLGAPLGHDFCVISLSDLLTPWELIEKRLLAAAEADFAICLYNPASKKRKYYLKKACELILRYRSPETICGYARNIGREGQEIGLLTLEQLREFDADMFTTVFIGNSQTVRIGERMVTPRGYV